MNQSILPLLKQDRFLTDAELAAAAREAREKAGLTQREAAERLGVKQPTVAQAERNPHRRLNRLRIEMIEKLGGARVEGPYWRIDT